MIYFKMAFTQPVSVLCDIWEPRGWPSHSVHAKPMCGTSQPQRPAGATCVSRASSAKRNCHQTISKVQENLDLFREHNTLYFNQIEGATVNNMDLMIRFPWVKKVKLVLPAFMLLQETIMGYLTKNWPCSHASLSAHTYKSEGLKYNMPHGAKEKKSYRIVIWLAVIIFSKNSFKASWKPAGTLCYSSQVKIVLFT